MKTLERIVYAAGLILLLVVGLVRAQEIGPPPPITLPPALSPVIPAPTEEEARFEVSGRYTAQRRPRVTVFDFENTNSMAQEARYGSSVEAMLVTFLKRKSQFVVVERQKLGTLNEERDRIDKGMIAIEPGDMAARQLLEKIDAFILGNVTLLNVPTDQNTTRGADQQPGGPDVPKPRVTVQGPRIEVDAKLLSRFDGRIIAAAQRSGPVACLRSIVERLGIALEQEFLRPYYGKLKVDLDDPENVRVFLTPILLDNALDEEKPPVELSSTVTIGNEFDIIETWTTDPTTYTVDNLLSGWYSMRLERPGYEELKADRARWEARSDFGQTEIYDRLTGKPLSNTDPEPRRFVVHVDPLGTEVIDGDALKFVFRKKGGSLAPLVRRQYLDTDFTQAPQRVILMGGREVDLNKLDNGPEEFADDQRCDLFDEKPIVVPNYGRTYISPSEKFDFATFKGGELIIEDYKGEIVPIGQYELALWEPNYQVEKTDVTVRDRDHKKVTRTSLVRETLPVKLDVTGARPANRVILVGRETHYRLELPLDFTEIKEQRGLPADAYVVSTNISGLEAWSQSTRLLPGSSSPPMYYTRSPAYDPKITNPSEEGKKLARAPRLTIKTRFGLGGRLEVFSRPPDPLAADVFIDRDLMKIFNLLLYGSEERPVEERGGLLKAAAQVGRTAVRILEETPVRPAPPSAEPDPGPAPAASSAPPAQTASGAPPASGDAPEDAAEEEKAPPPQLPRDPDELRKLLAQHLELMDLLVLDPQDMAQLRRSPEVAAIVQRYVTGGGALFAFVSETGDYGEVVGAPLVIEAVSKPTDRFNLASGEVVGIVPRFDKKKLDVKSKRALPELGKLAPNGPWRVVAFTQGRKDPRIVERGKREDGGYVALWFDDPDSFRGRLGGTVPEVEETRLKMEERILLWARFLMYRRYDKAGEQRSLAEKALR